MLFISAFNLIFLFRNLNLRLILLNFLYLIFSRIHSWKEQRRLPRSNTSSRVLPSQPVTRQNSRNALQSKSSYPITRQYSHSPLVKSYSSPSPNSARSSTSGSGGGKFIRTNQGKEQRSELINGRLFFITYYIFKFLGF